MVKSKKTDRDKWYYAAKEQGYRSRAAFKLIQLNKKFNFLANARACLDLCAAPGGWTQVASKYMPVSSIIIAVDLFPIRPIRNVTCLQEDITTQKCRHEIKKNLKGWKVDICLHDGAPNLGSAWSHDAYGQSVLTLAAVGLAVDFLREGGTFVTKVFRSADYNSLLWVFNQLFKNVTVTKPPASRNTSAEIFAVCEGFLAPKQLDPRFLDPKHVFKELDAPAEKDLYFGQKRAKRNREGYEEGSQLLFKKATISDFIQSENPTVILANNHRLEFDEKCQVYLNDRETTIEIQACFEDIQVLGKKEIKILLRWRLHMIKKYHADTSKETEPTEPTTDDQEMTEPLTEEQEEKLIDQEIEQQLTKAQQRMKQKIKKERKLHRKQQRRIDLKMDLIGDKFDVEEDSDLFGLTSIRNKEQLETLQEDDVDPANISDDSDNMQDNSESEDYEDRFLNAEDDYDQELEELLENQYKDFLDNAKKLSKAVTKKRNTVVATPADQQMAELEQKINDASKKTIYDSDSEDEKNPLLVKEKDTSSTSRRASQWFSQNLFDDVDMNILELPSQPRKPVESESNESEDIQVINPKELKVVETEQPEESEDFEVVPQPTMNDSDSEMDDYEKAELLAMGTLVKTGKMSLRDLIDDGFNRYTFNDTNLPTWFEDEEKQHNQPILPVTREMVQDILAENKALNSRPIKKVAEAKARKKMKAKRKLDKVKLKANSIAEDTDLSEVAKARAIEKLYKSQMAKMKTKQIYVVRGKGQKGKQKIGPKSSGSARVRVVDKRMKSDKRGQEASKRRQKKRR